jgi:hypothetical protein
VGPAVCALRKSVADAPLPDGKHIGKGKTHHHDPDEPK